MPLDKLRTSVSDIVLEVLWRQWRVIGGAAAGDDAKLIVDPEVLILASLGMFEHEARLEDTMRDWLIAGSNLISVQRIKNLATRFPEVARRRLPWLAQVAFRLGRDHRWRALGSLDDSYAAEIEGRRRKSTGPMLLRPASAMLRIRTAFGLSVKADLLAVLGGLDTAEELRVLTKSLGYARGPIHRAIQDLIAAGVVRGVHLPGGTGYVLQNPLLSSPESGRWGWWQEVLGFALALLELPSSSPAIGSYAQGVLLRRVVESWLPDLARARLVSRDLHVPENAAVEAWIEFTRRILHRVWWREREGQGPITHLVPDSPNPEGAFTEGTRRH